MKTLITKTLLSILLISCTSVYSNADQNVNSLKMSGGASSKIDLCPTNTTKHPTTFIIVYLDKNNLPKNALTPKPGMVIKKLNLNDPKLKFDSIVPKLKTFVSDHNTKRGANVCFISVVKDKHNATGYKFSKQPIAVLWRPNQKAKFHSNVVLEKIPKKSPLNIVYKFTIASAKSDPNKGDTYLDPRIVIR